MLISVKLETVGVAEQGTGLNAQQRVVGFCVVGMGVVAVVGGHDRRVDLAGDLQQLRVGSFLLRHPMVLKLDEIVVPPEDVLEPRCLLERKFLLAA